MKKEFYEWHKEKHYEIQDLGWYDSLEMLWIEKKVEIDELKKAYEEIDEYLSEIGEIDHFVRWQAQRENTHD